MNYIDSYKLYENDNNTNNTNNTNDLGIDITFNKKYNCLKINELYLFLDQEKAYLESELPMNEGMFDIDWEDFLPKTTSDWLHFSTDMITGVVSVLGPVGFAISTVLEIIHGLAYFTEAYYDEENSTSLIFGGVITLILAFVPAGSFTKAISKGGKGLLRTLLKFTGIPQTLKLTKFLLSFTKTASKTTSILTKHETSWWMKGLKKIPAVKKILTVGEKQMNKHAGEVANMIVKGSLKDAKSSFNKLFKANVEKSYNALNKNMRKSISLEDYSKVLYKNSEKHFPTVEIFKKNPEKYLKSMTEDGLNSTLGSETAAFASKYNKGLGLLLDGLKIEVKNPVAYNMLKRGFTRKANKEVVKAMKMGKTLEPSAFLKKYIENISPSTISGLIKRGVKVGVPALLKQKINSLTRDEEPEANSSIDNSVDDTNTKPDEIKDETKVESETVSGGDKPADIHLMDKHNLKQSHISNLEEMGESKIVFAAPNKKGEDAKFYMDGGIYNIFDFSNSMSLYSSEEELFDDLVKIGKKSSNKKKKNVRKGEMKKWEKTEKISTPFIESLENKRFEFDFLVRERSKISLATKKDVENINWVEVFSSNEWKENGSFKINNSLYITSEGSFTD